jgi:hypothetical protein
MMRARRCKVIAQLVNKLPAFMDPKIHCRVLSRLPSCAVEPRHILTPCFYDVSFNIHISSLGTGIATVYGLDS